MVKQDLILNLRLCKKVKNKKYIFSNTPLEMNFQIL